MNLPSVTISIHIPINIVNVVVFVEGMPKPGISARSFVYTESLKKHNKYVDASLARCLYTRPQAAPCDIRGLGRDGPRTA